MPSANCLLAKWHLVDCSVSDTGMLLQGDYAHTPAWHRSTATILQMARPTHLTHCTVLGCGVRELGNAHSAQHGEPSCCLFLCPAHLHIERRFCRWHQGREARVNALGEEMKPREGATGLGLWNLRCAKGGVSAQGKWPSHSSCQSGLLLEEVGTLASVARQPMSGQISWKENPTREASEHH